MSVFNKVYLVLLILSSCTIIQVSGQNIQLDRVPNEFGLSQNLVSALCQDDIGFIWVGTKNGLNRFDGYRFKVFLSNPFDSTTISDNYIHSIFNDSQGRLWLGTSLGLNLYDPQTESFAQIKSIPLGFREMRLEEMTITSILEDDKGTIWLGSHRNGVIRLVLKDSTTTSSTQVTHIFQSDGGPHSIHRNQVVNLIQDVDLNIWVCHKEYLSTISKLDGQDSFVVRALKWQSIVDDAKYVPKSLNNYRIKKGKFSKADADRYGLIKSGDELWLKTLDGFGKWNQSKQEFEIDPLDFDRSDYANSPLIGTGAVGLSDVNGNLWVGGSRNLVQYNPQRKEVLYSHKTSQPNSQELFEINCHSLLEDRSGIIWVGDNGRGLYKYAPLRLIFSNTEHDNPAFGQSIKAIHQLSTGEILFADYRQLYLWDRANQKAPEVIDLGLLTPSGESIFKHSNVFSLHEDSNERIWVGCKYRMFEFIRKGNKLQRNRLISFEDTGETVHDIFEDTNKELYLITNSSFGKFDPTTATYLRNDFKERTSSRVELQGAPCIYQSADGIFWLGTSEGLKKYDVNTKTFRHFKNNPQDRSSLSHNNIKSICPDPVQPSGFLWIGTGGGGLNKFDIKLETFEHFTTEDGLPDNFIYGVLADKELWLSTNRGLSQFDPINKTVNNFTTSEGLKDNEFNSGAYYKSPSSEFFFGGIKGFTSFLPSQINQNPYQPAVIFTDVYIGNKRVDFRTEQSYLSKPIQAANEIVLSHEDKIISFEFSSLDFTNPVKNKFSYKLSNFDDSWQHVGNKREATYTNIDPGHYTLKVKGSNSSGLWSDSMAQIHIIKKPPWWRTWLAYAVYVLLSGTVVYIIYSFQLNRQISASEAKRLKEIDELKTKLYTNITHEFRTPLTVILGLCEQLNASNQNSSLPANEQELFDKNLSLIQRSGDSLLRLVNQMLDLSKLKSGKMELQLENGDIIQFIQYLTESFHSLAIEKDIQLVYYSEIKSLNMDFDEWKVQMIIFNLLSNALKFTTSPGKVIVHVSVQSKSEGNHLIVKCKDDGIGIASENLSHVFSRFYQIEDQQNLSPSGTGVGLALVKELVELMDGHVQIESELDYGTCISVVLPIRNEVKLIKTSPIMRPKAPSQPISSRTNVAVLPASLEDFDPKGKPVVLVVEDSADIKDYINQILFSQYACLFVSNGQEGIDAAFEFIPDVIISDVMMPVKNGYELTKTLKKDDRTSHIPIIILTAKSEASDRLFGLKSGADAFLSKPFSKEELFVRLRQLIALRQKLRDRYTSNIKLTDVVELSVEDMFVMKLQHFIQEGLSDSRFDGDQLARKMGMSASQLYRKMKALTDNTPAHFIRKMRLDAAAEHLTNTKLNISEIAYLVGYSDPSYFSRAFSHEFGKSPSHYRK